MCVCVGRGLEVHWCMYMYGAGANVVGDLYGRN